MYVLMDPSTMGCCPCRAVTAQEWDQMSTINILTHDSHLDWNMVVEDFLKNFIKKFQVIATCKTLHEWHC
jgi:hypothetical protein